MTSPSTRLRALLFVLATLACPRVTHAADEATIKKATNLFEAGLRASENGDCATALPLFQESLAMYRSEALSALFNVALCERQLGQTGASYLHFREFLRDVKVRDDGITQATDAITAMMKAGPWIRVLNLDKLPADATTQLDGVSLGPITTTTNIPVKIGDHIVLIQVPGQSERRLSVYVHQDEHREVDVRPPQMRTLRRVGLILGGVGLGSLIAGTTTGIFAINANRELAEDCEQQIKACTQVPSKELEDRKDDGKNLSSASTATFIIGGALTAIGATLIFLPPSKSKEVAFSPLVLPDGAGLSATARF